MPAQRGRGRQPRKPRTGSPKKAAKPVPLPTELPVRLTLSRYERQGMRVIHRLHDLGVASFGHRRATRLQIHRHGLVARIETVDLPAAQAPARQPAVPFETHILVFYPDKKDAEAFAPAYRFVAGVSFSEMCPGSVGTLYALLEPPEPRTLTPSPLDAYISMLYPSEPNRTLTPCHLQGSFSQPRTPSLSRATATKYGGWRQHLLDALFQHVVLPRNVNRVVYQRSGRQRKTNDPILLAAAKKYGFHATKQTYSILVLTRAAALVSPQ